MSLGAAQSALQRLRSWLKSRFFERDAIIDGLCLALLSQEHVLLLGPPGTAKSQLVKSLAGCLSEARVFQCLLTKFSTPEELFGPISLSLLAEGRYERVIDGKLPEAEFVFLDEVFKANSAILNALLGVMNERVFDQGKTRLKLPLQCLVGASNELPEAEELGALYDRFLLRFSVGYLEDEANFVGMLKLAEDPGDAPELSWDQLFLLQREVPSVRIPEAVYQDLSELRRRLFRAGVVPSDRRFRRAIAVLQAYALLEERHAVRFEDFQVLKHVLWRDPEDQAKLEAVLSDMSEGLDLQAGAFLNQAKEVDAYARQDFSDATQRARAVLEAHTKLTDLLVRLDGLLSEARARGRSEPLILGVIAEVNSLAKRLLREQN